MKISNDTVSIESQDIASLTQNTKDALTAFIGERLPIQDRFSQLINELIQQAIAASPPPDIIDVKEAIADFSDEAKKAQAQQLIDQAQALVQQAADIIQL